MSSKKLVWSKTMLCSMISKQNFSLISLSKRFFCFLVKTLLILSIFTSSKCPCLLEQILLQIPCWRVYIIDNNPFLTTLIADFNAKSHNWCKEDRMTLESQLIYNLFNQSEFSQTIKEPTHLFKTFSPCIICFLQPIQI